MCKSNSCHRKTGERERIEIFKNITRKCVKWKSPRTFSPKMTCDPCKFRDEALSLSTSKILEIIFHLAKESGSRLVLIGWPSFHDETFLRSSPSFLFSRVAMGFPNPSTHHWRFAISARLGLRETPVQPSLDREISRPAPRSRGHVGGRNGIQVNRAWSAPWLHKGTEKRGGDWLPRLCDNSRKILFHDFASPRHNARFDTTLFRRVCLVPERERERQRESLWSLRSGELLWSLLTLLSRRVTADVDCIKTLKRGV